MLLFSVLKPSSWNIIYSEGLFCRSSAFRFDKRPFGGFVKLRLLGHSNWTQGMHRLRYSERVCSVLGGGGRVRVIELGNGTD